MDAQPVRCHFAITGRVTPDQRELINLAGRTAGVTSGESINQWCRRVLLEAAGKAVR